MNKMIFNGRFGKDPEIRHTPDGLCVASFSIAIDDEYSKGEDRRCDWLNCQAFGKTAEFIEKYMAQGKKVLCEGRYRQNKYKDRDGNDRYWQGCTVQKIEFAEPKTEAEKPKADVPATGAFVDVPDDFELPFFEG